MSIKAHGIFLVILQYIEVDDKTFFLGHPKSRIALLKRLFNNQVIYKIDVGIIDNAHAELLYSPAGIGHPELARKCKLLFAPWLEHDFVAPGVIDKGAVHEIILIGCQRKIIDGAHEIFIKQGDEAIIDIDILIHVAKILRNAFVLDA